MDLAQLIERVEWCRERECLPYVMRDVACWECDNKNFLIDYAAYCNQPSMFKKVSFADFLPKRIACGSIDEARMADDLVIYNTACSHKSEVENGDSRRKAL